MCIAKSVWLPKMHWEEWACCQNISSVAARAAQSDTGPKVFPATWGIAIAVIASGPLEVHISRLSW